MLFIERYFALLWNVRSAMFRNKLTPYWSCHHFVNQLIFVAIHLCLVCYMFKKKLDWMYFNLAIKVMKWWDLFSSYSINKLCLKFLNLTGFDFDEDISPELSFYTFTHIICVKCVMKLLTFLFVTYNVILMKIFYFLVVIHFIITTK